MTLSEFKAWFEGYTEGMDEKSPSAKQWAKIKDKVAAINGSPTVQHIWLDHYRRYYPAYVPHWVGGQPAYTTAGGATGGIGYATGATLQFNGAIPFNGGASASYAPNSAYAPKIDDSVTKPFDSHAAMYALGKAEALAA